MFFEKQKFYIKQLQINKFIKSIWQFIISTSNATLEVPSLSYLQLSLVLPAAGLFPVIFTLNLID